MRRRALLSAAAGCGAAALAGCTLSADELLVEEAVEEATIFEFDLEVGETVEIELESENDRVAYAELVGPNGEVLRWIEADPTSAATLTAEDGGTYELWVYPGGAVAVRAIVR